jgi:hypothetical protein
VKVCPKLAGAPFLFEEKANKKFMCRLGKSAAETLQA